MKILALEFSSDRRSVAWLDGPNELREIVEERPSASRGTHAFALLDELLKDDPGVDLLAVGLGPGSYAGIRAAISIAQGWQLAKEVPVVGLSSVAALVSEVKAEGLVHVAIDAHRGEFYLATYEISGLERKETEPLRLATAEEVKLLLAAGHQVFGPELPQALGGGLQLFPSAAAVACLAAAQPVVPVPAETLEPIYLRPVNFVKVKRPVGF